MIIRPNPAPPQVMHIDLNSAFAMTEQQANPLLRGRPVGITNRLNDYAICITASYEAKRQGIGSGAARRNTRSTICTSTKTAKTPSMILIGRSKGRILDASIGTDPPERFTWRARSHTSA